MPSSKVTLSTCWFVNAMEWMLYLTIFEWWGSCDVIYLRSGSSLKAGLGAGVRPSSLQAVCQAQAGLLYPFCLFPVLFPLVFLGKNERGENEMWVISFSTSARGICSQVKGGWIWSGIGCWFLKNFLSQSELLQISAQELIAYHSEWEQGPPFLILGIISWISVIKKL